MLPLMPRPISRLYMLRIAERLSQQDLAAKLGVSRQTVHAIEQGKTEPSLSLAHKCARFFCLTIEEIFPCKD
ncbi:MAG: XRE family transcriptional regulator [Candidatus Uhrbacteria bacterium GW2011_GWD2_52_7]|uniref:XRE family transcriptional regulator n=1 Tax=Candidatus Uhrbacteria bacterium GW2011_GWD2_52_7 TaxID=1618989 RepID=A0A0G2AD79_9BACT|nr:MAG: XRE family transcriptional regulator [Candidatus Uhrbacteria bacterium GW2011_GWD2_52_7]